MYSRYELYWFSLICLLNIFIKKIKQYNFACDIRDYKARAQ